jgi:hypothetical protein
MITMFNVLTLLASVGVLVCLVYVRRLRAYIASPSWTLKEWAFYCFLAGQLGGLVNIAWLAPSLNWLGLVNTGLRVIGIGLLAASYITLDKTLHRLFEKLRIKTTPVNLDKPGPPVLG